MGQLLGPSDLGQKKEQGLTFSRTRKFSTSKIKTHQVNKCGCDFLMSSSNSQVESPILRSQMTLTRLTVFPRRSSTLLSSRAMGGTSTMRSSPICISSTSNTWAGSNTYFLSCDTWNTGWRFANYGGKAIS